MELFKTTDIRPFLEQEYKSERRIEDILWELRFQGTPLVINRKNNLLLLIAFDGLYYHVKRYYKKGGKNKLTEKDLYWWVEEPKPIKPIKPHRIRTTQPIENGWAWQT